MARRFHCSVTAGQIGQRWLF